MAQCAEQLDLLLFHGWFLAHDPLEQEIMRPFPPLGIQYLVAWLRSHDFPNVDWWDASFSAGPEEFEQELARESQGCGLVWPYGDAPLYRWSNGPQIGLSPSQADRIRFSICQMLDGGVEVVVIGRVNTP